jgi:hypothetical protein
MPALNVCYVEQKHSIEIRADLRQGRDREDRTYAFVRNRNVEHKGDIVLRIQIRVYPKPVGLGSKQQLFPAALSSSGTNPISFEVADCNLILRIPLIREGGNPDLPWRRTKDGKHRSWWSGNFNLGEYAQMHYTADVLVVEHSERPMLRPIDWVDGEKDVFSGHFESNRRRTSVVRQADVQF